ncbi:PQQ-dependent sugar dehydrogenase [Microvirga brassicacearum]|uniref:Sorbosone dehydrogenase n=1 Tax=Microvirga brassicacearum TaxID=2580413 RepID=A0A5N3P8Z0_9HYPH|nr:PQQ-dependent sugar dehydrogenase [Microvirga brassicacearum]KAB0266200.1 sorbosone dehydrogenase [Microvirga brassicacearum]
MSTRSRILSAGTAAIALSVALSPALAQPTSPAASTGPLADQELGRRFQVKPAELPAPHASPAVSNAPLILPYQGQSPRVPDGFTATPLVIGLENPRRLLVLPNGDVIVAEQKPGYLTFLRDEDGDGRAEWVQRHAEGFNGPYGLAWRDDHILVADQDGIWKVPHKLGGVRAGHGEQKPIAQVPPEQRKPDPRAFGQELITAKGVFGLIEGHANRDLDIDPKTGALFVGVGSAGNIGVEPEVKASIQRFDADGKNQSLVAGGLRNPTGLAFHPDTGDLYAVVQERDGLGDGLVPDYLTRVEKGAFYGWPYAYIGQNPQPGFAERAPEKVKATVTPDLLFEAHSSALDLVFYDKEQFPDDYRGDAFVVLKGSWNRADPTGYKVVRVPFKDGRPEGWYENFMTGFWLSGRERAEVWGRPAAVAIAKDGSLLVADDTGGTIWKVSHAGAASSDAATGSVQPRK